MISLWSYGWPVHTALPERLDYSRTVNNRELPVYDSVDKLLLLTAESSEMDSGGIDTAMANDMLYKEYLSLHRQ